jgi:hypothetical protein
MLGPLFGQQADSGNQNTGHSQHGLQTNSNLPTSLLWHLPAGFRQNE